MKKREVSFLLKMNRFLRQSVFIEGVSLHGDCPKTARGWFIFRDTAPPLLKPARAWEEIF